MRDCHAYDYAILRVVPQVEREEFLNVGVILSCADRQFLGVQLHLDTARLSAFAPSLDLEVLRVHLASFEAVCRGGAGAGPIGELPPRQRFLWLVAPRSTIIQTSPVHTGWLREPEETIGKLLRQYAVAR